MTTSFTFGRLLAVITICLTALAVIAGTQKGKSGRAKIDNAKRLAQAAIIYGADYEDRIPPMIDGDMNAMKNVDDKGNSGYNGLPRTDSWVMLLLPYHNDLKVYVDPVRGDKSGTFSAPATADGSKPNNYRAQNRFPMYGMNYIFLSPMETNQLEPSFPVISRSKSFLQATEPSQTIFFTESSRWTDVERGHYGVNAPGSWILAQDTLPYVVLWFGTDCSGDWCATPAPMHNTFYEGPKGSNVSFLDGHSAYMKAARAAAGTTYPKSKPDGVQKGGSTLQIVDTSKYLWNLDDEYYGLANQ